MESQSSRNSLPSRRDKTSLQITCRCQQSVIKSCPVEGARGDLKKKEHTMLGSKDKIFRAEERRE